MKVVHSNQFRGHTAWGVLHLLRTAGFSARLHWTNQPYSWLQLKSDELFAVMDGSLNIHYLQAGNDRLVRLRTGDLFSLSQSIEYVAMPDGHVRVLVVGPADNGPAANCYALCNTPGVTSLK